MADELAVCPCGQIPEKLTVEGPDIYKSRARVTDYSAGQLGTSDAPGNCPDCGAIWANSERLHTGDDKGIGGWEDWLHCKSCGCEIFYPVTRRDAANELLVDDLASLLRRLAHSLRKAEPGNDLAERALDYLQRHGLAGVRLRGTDGRVS